ncbi:hypothetical protein ACUNWD_00185 [Sunxiuqinia sp. A32]|uniref:hypothetical protein n=1 Tax=Sunxiuqinia sp. A32 TaxID=3461496 RepID=UPI0040456E7A
MRNPVLILIAFFTFSYSINGRAEGRDQWSETQAWEWESKVGIIKGFNAPSVPYPGMDRSAILEKAASLGYNSVRIWIPPGTERSGDFLQGIVDEASKYHMTVSPVLRTNSYFKSYFDGDNRAEAEKEIKDYLINTVGRFKDDPRIIFWDVANEPALRYSFDGKAWEKEGLEEIELVQNIVRWTRELNPAQPVTSSALFLTEHVYEDNKVHSALKELASMSDIHNFHLYDLSVNRMKALDDMVALLKSLGDRPITCTEIVGRTRGGTFARSLTACSKYHIHFYNWGMYTSDANWDVAWDLSSFEPYEPWFHDVLHPDGYPYDWRDLEWVRTFHFVKKGEQADPGAEITERWNKWRAWKWMATGPVKGFCMDITGTDDLQEKIDIAAAKGYNSIKVKLDINEWKKDTANYYAKVESLLSYADKNGIDVMPTLLTDQDADMPTQDIDVYVSRLVANYGFDTRVIAWELYNKPGKSGLEQEKVKSLLSLVFRVARFEFPNQPLTATPVAKVQKFAPDFKYHDELIHGHRNGWRQVEFVGSSDAELCNYVWSLSDIISFESDMPMPETGWLLNIANRYGRPVVCSNWDAPNDSDIESTLELFSKNKVYWYNGREEIPEKQIKSFQFSRISTPRR